MEWKLPGGTNLKALGPGIVLCLLLQSCWMTTASGQEYDEIQTITIHPIVDDLFACREHAEGELERFGDALGSDCFVFDMVKVDSDRHIPALHQNDGLSNEDWFSWEARLLAPFDGTVESMWINPETNRPGEHPGDEAIASSIEFLRADGVHVVYVHVRNVEVQSGDAVAAGELVAEIGNNGTSPVPHVHIGAWKDDTPLQIRFDLRAKGRLQGSNN